MDQVTVPQFIENEDKILGPITVRQFVIMFVAAIIIFLVYKFADFLVFLFTTILVGGIAAVLAFFKVNGQPFHFFVLHIIQTLKRPSLRVWRKSVSRGDLGMHHGKMLLDDEGDAPHPVLRKERLSDRKINELSLIVDTGGAYMGEHDGGSELFHNTN